MSNTDSELRQDIGVYCSMYATAREENDIDKMRRCIDAIEALLAAQKQRWARDYWLYVHDIIRDKSTETIGIQEAIDVASEAYKLLTGEDIQKWFDKDAALDGVIEETK